jgi:hypothetical protein
MFSEQSVTQIISVTIMNLVIPKDGAMHELLFNEPASVLFQRYIGIVLDLAT